MSTVYSNLSTFSRFNLEADVSDIQMFVNEYRQRINMQVARDQTSSISPFVSFHENKIEAQEQERKLWFKDNQDRFFKDSPNVFLKKERYLSEMGYITSMVYSPEGDFIIVGHSTGLIQFIKYYAESFVKQKSSRFGNGLANMPNSNLEDEDETKEILTQFKETIDEYYRNDNEHKLWYCMFARNYQQKQLKRDFTWVQNNNKQFLENTANKILQNRWFSTECGFITALTYSPNGERIIVGHSNGLIQMRHGHSGTVLATLRSIQFPPKTIYALEYCRNGERTCYAACADGIVYKIDIPLIDTSGQNGPEYCITADPALEWLNTQYYAPPGINMAAAPFISQRSPALSLGVTADSTKMIVGYADASVKIYDMATQEVEQIFKVHKTRLQFIPKKLQRLHAGHVCALRCHNEKQHMFASAAWDNTLRIWDTRCKVGCMMTFEGVNVCHDSIDLNREQALSGSWQNSEAICTWDLVAKKRLNIIRVQNRRPDVDGEYVYACRYWRSNDFNRKGKYGIIGGSGTGCVEVINLHNRYITCSYPAPGTVLAVASYGDRIAFGGTAPVFNLVSFHDPKHEEYKPDETPPYDFSLHPVTLFETLRAASSHSSYGRDMEGDDEGEMDGEETKVTSAKSMKSGMGLHQKSVCTDISKNPFKESKIKTTAPK